MRRDSFSPCLSVGHPYDTDRRYPLPPGAKSSHVEDSECRLPVLDFTVPYHLQGPRERHWLQRQELVFVTRLSPRQPGGQEEVTAASVIPAWVHRDENSTARGAPISSLALAWRSPPCLPG